MMSVNLRGEMSVANDPAEGTIVNSEFDLIEKLAETVQISSNKVRINLMF